MSCTPETLVASAKCFLGLSRRQLLAIWTLETCGGVTPPTEGGILTDPDNQPILTDDSNQIILPD